MWVRQKFGISFCNVHRGSTLILAVAAFPPWVFVLCPYLSPSALLVPPGAYSCPLSCPCLDFYLMRFFPSLHSFSFLADLKYNRCDIPEESWIGHESDVAYASYIPGSIIWAKQYGYPWQGTMAQNILHELGSGRFKQRGKEIESIYNGHGTCLRKNMG